MRFWNRIRLLDPKTENAKNLVLYHDLVLIVVVMVLVLVGWFLTLFLLKSFFIGGGINRYVYKNELLEIIWTIVPAFFLFGLGYVSLYNLYRMEVGEGVQHVVKVTGHQWYWEYEYTVNFSNIDKIAQESWFKASSLEGGDFRSKEIVLGLSHLNFKGDWFLVYESFMIPEGSLSDRDCFRINRGFRNQDVTNPCFLIYGYKNEVLVSTADVMHRWGVSELGVKADAIPGRTNSLAVSPFCSGLAFGNCYELCGAGHRTIPINVFITSLDNLLCMLKEGVLSTDEGEEHLKSVFPIFSYLNDREISWMLEQDWSDPSLLFRVVSEREDLEEIVIVTEVNED